MESGMSSNRKQKRKRTVDDSETSPPSSPATDCETRGVLKSIRDNPYPPAYTFEIENFSLLTSLKFDNYESGVFRADGYKWKLSLYPNGNTKGGDGEGHISLYLVIADTKDLSYSEEVKVIFKLFVYDNILSRYLTVEDRKVRCFTKLKTEWGFDQFMSKEDFNDPSNQFISEYDSCTFGAEVSVIKPQRQERLEMIKDPVDGFFVWKLMNFSEIGDKCLISDEFYVAGQKWKLVMHPDRGKGLSLSLFLRLVGYPRTLPSDGNVYERNLYVKYKLRIRDQVHGNHHDIEDDGVFSSQSWAQGHVNFLTLEDLKDQSNGFLLNDTVIIEAEIMAISVYKVWQF